MAKETVSCIICGKEHEALSDDVAKIFHPTKLLTAVYACRSHKGINEEHAKCFPKGGKIYSKEAEIYSKKSLEEAQRVEAESDQILSIKVGD